VTIVVAGASWPEEKIRPLDHFSDFVCSELGQRNDQIRAGRLDPDVLFRECEDLMSIISTDRIAVLQLPENIRTRRVALLDLVWAERSLDVAYNRSAEYKARKRRWTSVGVVQSSSGGIGAGIWEPFVTLDSSGHLALFFSDERQHATYSPTRPTGPAWPPSRRWARAAATTR
jgi:hypothetical protein